MVTPVERGAVLLLCAVLTVLYAPILGAAPLAWDDGVWLEDPVVLGPAAEAVHTAFTTAHDGVYAPILRLAFRVLAPGGPYALHGAVIGCFFLALFALQDVLARVGIGRIARTAALVIWSTSALRVENLAWITGLKDTLSLLLLALGARSLLAPSDGHDRRTIAGGLWMALALGVRGSLAPVLIGLGAVDLLWRGRDRAVRWALPAVAAVAAAWVGQSAWLAGPVTAARPEVPTWVLALRVLRALTSGVDAPCAIPTFVAEDRPLLFAVVPTGVFAVLLVLTGTSLSARPDDVRPNDARPDDARPEASHPPGLHQAFNRYGAGYGAAAIALTLASTLPFLGVVPMAFWGANRHALLPTLFSTVGVAAIFFSTPRWRASRAAWAGVGIIAALQLTETSARVPAWRDDLSLWTAEKQCPGKHWARELNLGMAQARAGDFEAAAASFQEGTVLNPDHDGLLGRLIVAHLAARGFDETAAAISAVAVPPPEQGAAWTALATALFRHGDTDLADLAITHAIRRREDHRPEAYAAAAQIAHRKGDELGMRKWMEEALRQRDATRDAPPGALTQQAAGAPPP